MDRTNRRSSNWAGFVAVIAVTGALGVLYLPLFFS
jgi:hypothetical protein